jgi:hypothetical protein
VAARAIIPGPSERGPYFMAKVKIYQGEQTDESLADYRKLLEQAYDKQSEAYDKTVIALSGGALGISMTFLHEIVPSPLGGTLWLLGAAWSAFAFSILAILVSILTGQWALRRAMCQVDLESTRRRR